MSATGILLQEGLGLLLLVLTIPLFRYLKRRAVATGTRRAMGSQTGDMLTVVLVGMAIAGSGLVLRPLLGG